MGILKINNDYSGKEPIIIATKGVKIIFDHLNLYELE
jgi:hypothetical protein